MKPSEDKIEKLPKWAKDYIHELESKVTKSETRLDAGAGAIIHYKGLGDSESVPGDHVVKFGFDAGKWLTINHVRDKGAGANEVVIYCSHGVALLPIGSNSLGIKIR